MVWCSEQTDKNQEKIGVAGGVSTSTQRRVRSIAEHVNFILSTAQPVLRTQGRVDGWNIHQTLAINI